MTDTILVVLAETRAAAATLQAAADAARALKDVQLDVLHVRVDPLLTMLAGEEVLTLEHRAMLERDSADEGKALKQQLDAWQKTLEPPLKCTWLDVSSTIPPEVIKRANGAVLVVIGKIRADSREHQRAAFNAALFHGQRPMLMVPRRFQGSYGKHIVIGWKDSETTNRAVNAALPWLKRAQQVSVVRVNDNANEDMAGARKLLEAAGIEAAYHVVPFGGLSAGQRLLVEIERLGGDSAVIGAYGRNRVLEWIFGGVTADVFDETRVPVLTQH